LDVGEEVADPSTTESVSETGVMTEQVSQTFDIDQWHETPIEHSDVGVDSGGDGDGGGRTPGGGIPPIPLGGGRSFDFGGSSTRRTRVVSNPVAAPEDLGKAGEELGLDDVPDYDGPGRKEKKRRKGLYDLFDLDNQ
jgi:hypothetical protein